MNLSIQEFYENNIVDPDFDETLHLKWKPEAKDFYQPFCKENSIDDKHRLFFHYMSHVLPQESQDIINFYLYHDVDKDFDHKTYLQSNPHTKNFYKEYCDKNGISDRERLFYHSYFYFSDDKSKAKKIRITSYVDLLKSYYFRIRHLADLELKTIDQFLPPHRSFAKQYDKYLKRGQDISKDSSICVVGLARNCDEALEKSINSIQSIQCKELKLFIFENDSEDNTKDILLDNEKKYDNMQIKCISNKREYLQDMSLNRTTHLAEYRNICIEWVKDNCSDYDYVMVLDLDADLGFSVEGIYNSIGWFHSLDNAGGIGSYSLCFSQQRQLAHYDSFASRLNDWEPNIDYDKQRQWFTNWHPLIGSDPVRFNSCFGGLSIYKTEAFLSGRYGAELGSEHVQFHKKLYENGYKMYLNPSSRFFAVFNNYK